MFPLFILIGSLALTNYQLLKLFRQNDREIRPITFNMGNGRYETSAHFLPKDQLISFLVLNKIRMIASDEDIFFLKMPVDFYYKIYQWQYDSKNMAMINYDYGSFGSGYIWYLAPASKSQTNVK